ncbi:hypothetical protein Hbl1158_10530 [Halobaculum sp. CBA1158]|uniref:hypothetical protein n=1 Tax=Halobaculum sp. CBA1158 TaxID=2904243 RepID=UPI001F2F90A1|nr:hypothetical protein [Halobaculum sp. CBA1158]UIO98969.1 hypothetical protein Hbl1158_10530 [Halobaculum sp. CBA1158]
MDTRRTVAEYPLQVLLGVAFLVALVATALVAATGESLALTLRLAALTTVLFAFAGGLSAGPLAERYL